MIPIALVQKAIALLSGKGASASLNVALAALLFMAYSEIQNDITRRSTDYAFNVISYNLQTAETSEDFFSLVRKWKEDDWGAQLGAIKTLCDNAPDRLSYLTNDVPSACRLAR